jgi:hypothetical protein
MLKNLSYNDPKIQREVQKSVGSSFSFLERIKFGGVGSSKLEITHASAEIAELLNRDNNLNLCSVELLKKGIIVRFRSILETYGLVIPFYQLVIFKGEAERLSLHQGQHKITVKLDSRANQFFKKVLEHKTKLSGVRIEDL